MPIQKKKFSERFTGLYTPQDLRDDGSNFYYHYTSNIDGIRTSGKIHATADASVYFIAHIENRRLGGGPPNGVIAIDRSCVEIKPILRFGPWNLWKSSRGELTSPAGYDIKILKASQQYLTAGQDVFSAWVVTDAELVPQNGWRKIYGYVRRAARIYVEAYVTALAGILFALPVLWVLLMAGIYISIANPALLKSIYTMSTITAAVILMLGGTPPIFKAVRTKMQNMMKELNRHR